ncbi:hypothetical protein D3C86_1896980 [compost metagenome]
MENHRKENKQHHDTASRYNPFRERIGQRDGYEQIDTSAQYGNENRIFDRIQKGLSIKQVAVSVKCPMLRPNKEVACHGIPWGAE